MSALSHEPVSTYEQALWWLIKNVPEPEMLSMISGRVSFSLPLQLVADVFWVTHSQMRAHLKKLWGEFH